MKRSILIVSLSIVLMLSFTNIMHANDNVVNDDQLNSEEKITADVNIKDDFADDRVLVVLNKETTMNLSSYTLEDFPEIECVKLTDSTEAMTEQVKKQINAEKTGRSC